MGGGQEQQVIDRKTVGDRLRALRGDSPREAVAIACGVTASAISMYETGSRMPSDAIKVKLAEYFGKTVQEIFFD